MEVGKNPNPACRAGTVCLKQLVLLLQLLQQKLVVLTDRMRVAQISRIRADVFASECPQKNEMGYYLQHMRDQSPTKIRDWSAYATRSPAPHFNLNSCCIPRLTRKRQSSGPCMDLGDVVGSDSAYHGCIQHSATDLAVVASPELVVAVSRVGI